MSFIRKGAARPPPGTRPSVFNGRLLVSSGLDDLDVLLGGGIPVGSLFLLEDDASTRHTSALLRYFASEAFVCTQSVAFVGSEGGEAVGRSSIMPVVKQSEPDEMDKSIEEKEDLRIAWQYKRYAHETAQGLRDAPRPTSSSPARGVRFAHTFDLSRIFDLESCAIPWKEFVYRAGRVSHVLEEIERTVQEWCRGRSVVRLVVDGSHGWGLYEQPDEIFTLIYALRGLSRRRNVVVMISLIPSLLPPATIRNVEHMCDTVLVLQGVPQTTNPTGHEGLVCVRALPRLNSLSAVLPETLTFGYKLGRRRMRIEKLHLPPDVLNPSTSRSIDF